MAQKAFEAPGSHANFKKNFEMSSAQIMMCPKALIQLKNECMN